MMNDVKEFGSVVRSESSTLVASAANSMKEQLNISVNLEEASEATKFVASSISGFLGNVVKHVTPILPDSDEDDDSSMVVGTTSGVRMMSPSQTRLYNIQTDPATYCNEPDSAEAYEAWLPTFTLEDMKEEMSTLMLDSKEVRSIYTKLVPEAVSHTEFWNRYFYRVHLHNEAERRRALLLERAQQSTELTWEDDDDSSDETAATAPQNDQEETKPLGEVKEEAPEQANISRDRTEPNSFTKETVVPTEPTNIPQPAKNPEPTPNPISSTSVSESDKGSTRNPEQAVESNVESSLPESIIKDESNKPVESNESAPAAVSTSATDKDENVDVKDSASGGSNDSWEKEFNLDEMTEGLDDMTEEEIKEALKEADDAQDIEDDWETWE